MRPDRRSGTGLVQPGSQTRTCGKSGRAPVSSDVSAHSRLNGYIPMLFKKEKPTAQPTQRAFIWPDENRKVQGISFNIDSYLYTVSCSYGKWTFEVEGKAISAPLKGLVVTASIETLDPFEPPRRLMDRWRDVPEWVEGTCSFLDSDHPFHPPRIHATLYCQTTAVDSVFRAFSLAQLHSSGAALVVGLKVDCPNNEGGPFWRDAWRNEELQVLNWSISHGSK